MTQLQHFWKAHRRVSDANIAFMAAVKDGLTRTELVKLIALRPQLWGRFENWLPRLP